MFSPGFIRTIRYPARIERILDRASPVILGIVVVFFIIHGIMLVQQSDGGSDLVGADIPKSLMVLSGQDPYSVQPWASPYPPLLLAVDSGIIRFASFLTGQTSVDQISQNIRLAGLAADTIVALTIYLYLRGKTANPAVPLVSSGLFLILPALSTSPLFFFHSDTFGYPLLALSLVALAAHRYLIGTSLLATATVFKIHPILSLPLVLVWMVRTRSLRTAVPSVISTMSILGMGLLLPFTIPGYASSLLGFNLSNDGNGSTIYSLLGLANGVLPGQLQVTPTTLLANQVWIMATLALFTILFRTVWMRAQRLGPVDVVLLGLLAWLIPLKIVYTHYLAWAAVPVLMRGQLRQTITVLGMLQVADTFSYWSSWPSTSLIPGIDTFYGLVATSMIYRAAGLAALGYVLYSLRKRRVFAITGEESGGESFETLRPGLESPLVTQTVRVAESSFAGCSARFASLGPSSSDLEQCRL